MNLKKYIINDIEYNVAVNSVTNDRAEVTVNGVVYQVKIENANTSAPVTMPMAESVDVASAPVEAPAVVAPSGSGKPINSPLPGVIVGIKVKVGDKVKAGQVVAMLEAMKMENEIQSEYDGIVLSVNVSQGDSILEGAPIVIIG
jgi:biotin carboxyl carrier protein